MSENKTKPTGQSVEAFLNSIPAAQKRADSFVILEMMRRVTGLEPKMWGESIIGFGLHHYKYESGREGDEPQIGFSPRKQNLTLYIMPCLGSRPDLTVRLGKFKTSKVCLYINKLTDVDLEVLEKLIRQAFSAGS